MRRINLGQLVNTIANLGVIAGIIFLGVELQQNSDTLELQQRISAKQSLDTLRAEMRSNPELRVAVQKDSRGEELTPDEFFLLQIYAANTVDTVAWIWHLSPKTQADLVATLPDFSLNRLPPTIGNVLRQRLGDGAYDPDFIEFVQQDSTEIE